MPHILYPSQLQHAVARVTADDTQGTGFLIAPDLVLTAYHVVQDAADLTVTFLLPAGEHVTSATAELLGPPMLDLAVLRLSQPPAGVTPLSLNTTEPRQRAPWESFGFAALHLTTGRIYRGRVLQRNELAAWPLTLEVDGMNPGYSLEGLSGSPLVVNDQVCGVLRYQQGEDVGAMLLSQVADELATHGVIAALPSVPTVEPIAPVPNQAVLTQLIDVLVAGGSDWYALIGSPGVGKSTLVATFEPTASQPVMIAGRYYLGQTPGVTESSAPPSREQLLEWLNDLSSQRVRGEQAPAPDPAKSFEERRQQGWQRLQELGEYFQQREQTGVLVVDGFDETLPELIRQELLGVLPVAPPAGLAFLLSTTSLQALSAGVRARLGPPRLVEVTLLPLLQCEQYLLLRLPPLTPTVRQLLAARSEGHPLYLQYLIRQVETRGLSDEETARWLTTIPPIEGVIQHYYEREWPALQAHPGCLQVVLTVSAVRQPLSRSQLYELLSPEVQASFEADFSHVAHLFKSSTRIELYHASLGQFLRERAASMLHWVQDTISAHLARRPADAFSVAHRVYHWAASSTPTQAIEACSQEWADGCAQLHLAADSVLADVQAAKRAAIEAGDLPGIVRLQLLHLRLAYRYNELLGAHTAPLAAALLARGEFEAALRYMVRGDVLQVPEEDALLFTQQFYEYGATEQGRTLREYLQRQAERLIEQDHGYGLMLLGQCRSLLGYENLELADHYFTQNIGQLRALSRDATVDEEQQGLFGNLARELSTYHTAVRTWCLGRPTISVQEIASKLKPGRHLSPDVTGNWAQTAVTALGFQLVRPERSVPEAFYQLIRDAEWLAEHCGYQSDDLPQLVGLLLEYGTEPTIIARLATEHIANLPTFSLRESNGVDLSASYVPQMLLWGRCQGYVDPAGTAYPTLPASFNAVQWEQQLNSALSYLGYLEGQLLRHRADQQLTQVAALLPRLQAFWRRLPVSLAKRGTWERSYALPEAVLPLVWQSVARLYRDFFPNDLPAWATWLEERAEGQLGLYAEGFREAYYRIADAWRGTDALRRPAFRVLECVQAHVLAGVQNRWERTEALLRLMDAYAGNRNAARSQMMYDEMLATSMGPAWYKEAQFSLVSTAVQCLPTAQGQVAELAATLEAAAAEMTFQRNVRSEKAGLVATLAKQGRLTAAISYYQIETLPEAATVLANASTPPIDQLAPGEGYVLGAHALSEPAALAGLLACPSLDPGVVWLAGHAFSRNQDTERYAPDYGQLLGRCLERLEATCPGTMGAWLTDWIADLADSHFSADELRSLLPSLGNQLSEPAYAQVTAALANHPGLLALVQQKRPTIPSPSSTPASSPPTDGLTGWPGVGRSDAYGQLEAVLLQAADEADMGDMPLAADMLGRHATALWQGGWDIWMGDNYSSKLGQLLRDLATYAATPAKLVRVLAAPLADSPGWHAADYLLDMTGPALPPAKQQEIMSLVVDHFRLLTKPEQSTGNKYAFLREAESPADANAQVVKLLIWHLGHPDPRWRQQASTALIRLAEHRPALVVTQLLDVALHPVCTGAWHEAAAALLPILAQAQPQAVGETITAHPHLVEEVTQRHHFLLRCYLLDALRYAATAVPAAAELHQLLWATVPATPARPPAGEVALEYTPALGPVMPVLRALNAEHYLTGAFCRELENLVTTAAQPLTITEQLRADRYIVRSFFITPDLDASYTPSHDPTYVPPFAAKVRYALNHAVMSRADQQNWADLRSLLS